LYSRLPAFVLGFHGCDRKVAEEILNGKGHLKPSNNSYDWLGRGIYFWENDPTRALAYAKNLKKHPNRVNSKIRNPAVIGAIIDLGNCLNLVDSKSLHTVKTAYELLSIAAKEQGKKLPVNKSIKKGGDLLLRKLDCAVINTIHRVAEDSGGQPYDSVRGVFWEGDELYPNAGFKEGNHIQIAVTNLKCIKGYFLPQL
jgi:hypothetical protein